MKTLAFMRMLGYILTDGYIKDISKSIYKSYTVRVWLGHIIDLNTFIKDLSLFVRIKQTKFIS